MTTKALLQHRHTAKLTWAEPWTGLDANGNEITCDVEYSATVDHCVALARYSLSKRSAMKLSEEQLLGDFMVIHWIDENSIKL